MARRHTDEQITSAVFRVGSGESVKAVAEDFGVSRSTIRRWVNRAQQFIPNRMDLREFRQFGYLQEVNRQFFHPLGLALEVRVNEDGTEELGGIWDYRHDPEGLYYGEGMLSMDKAARVAQEYMNRAQERKEHRGWILQPLPQPERHDHEH